LNEYIYVYHAKCKDKVVTVYILSHYIISKTKRNMRKFLFSSLASTVI